MEITQFQQAILTHYIKHGRTLAWRETTNTYKILVSEFMLQQTQVSRVKEKYEEFLQAFPTAQDLVDAELKDVFKIWQGLGYNRRAKYLKHAASLLAQNENPTRNQLLELAGIGPYTAAAVCAFAYNEDVAAIDVNVERIFQRYFGTTKQIEETVPKGKSRDWHNALMDFGSMICTKRNPKCEICPLQKTCHAYEHNTFATEKSATQNKFEGSVRWHRGQVLKQTLEKPRTKEELWKNLSKNYRDKEKLEKALEALLLEGIIKHENGNYHT